MACCKCCCGNAICEEGDQGKCCCGGEGPNGDCCEEGEYCCDGVCENEPCDCSQYEHWTLTVEFCSGSFTWSSDGEGSFSTVYEEDSDIGGCCIFGVGDVCNADRHQRTGPGISWFGGVKKYELCTGVADRFLPSYACQAVSPTLTLDDDPDSPNFGKCVGGLSLIAEGPTSACNYFWCAQYYTADIIDGELENVQVFPIPEDSVCACDDPTFRVTLEYNALP